MTSPFDVLLEPTENKGAKIVTLTMTDTSGRYRIGPPTRPNIVHDNGFLDVYETRKPSAADKLKLAQWIVILEGAEDFCVGPSAKITPGCHGEELTDATAAYRHFLFGNGADRTINYERYLQDDPEGRKLMPILIRDFQEHAEIIGHDRTKFSVTSTSYPINKNSVGGYPSTENWQKAIGAHFVWLSADITVSAGDTGEITYDADVTVHMEDRYNFNPGQADKATGIPDAANGRFEITGLGKQYTNFATVRRHVTWVEGTREKTAASGAPSDRQRKPQDSRRLRNKV